jgi:ubiquinone/menaquinone biosynthesis C-methylase UbiE
MHDTAYNNALSFYTKYCATNIETKTVLDIGSLDVNGTMKPIFQSAYKYIGLDQCKGRNVNMISSSHNIPLSDDSVDIIISSSCFEHDNMFWITFKEMCRLIKNGGYIYINAPSNGPYHAYPVDNWRFYADSWKALKDWANHLGYDIELVESYIDKNKSSCGYWNDSVGIFTKNKFIL